MLENPRQNLKIKTFETTDGRKSNLQIVSRETLCSEGHLVQRVVANILGENDKSKQGTFVLKTFGNSELARHSVTVNAKLKEIGVKAWPTYRIDTGGHKSVIMTDGELLESDTLITSNNFSKSIWEIAESIDSIQNLENSIGYAIKDASLAGESGIKIPDDAWMGQYKINKENRSADVRFFIGDLEGVGGISNSDDNLNKDITKKIVELNLLILEKSLSSMIQLTVAPELFSQYETLLKNRIKSAIQNLNQTN